MSGSTRCAPGDRVRWPRPRPRRPARPRRLPAPCRAHGGGGARAGVVEGRQGQYVCSSGAPGQLAGTEAGCHHEPVPGELVAAVEGERPRDRIKCDRLRAGREWGSVEQAGLTPVGARRFGPNSARPRTYTGIARRFGQLGSSSFGSSAGPGHRRRTAPGHLTGVSARQRSSGPVTQPSGSLRML